MTNNEVFALRFDEHSENRDQSLRRQIARSPQPRARPQLDDDAELRFALSQYAVDGWRPVDMSKIHETNRPLIAANIQNIPRLPRGQSSTPQHCLESSRLVMAPEIFQSMATSLNDYLKTVSSAGLHGSVVDSLEVEKCFYLQLLLALDPGPSLEQNFAEVTSSEATAMSRNKFNYIRAAARQIFSFNAQCCLCS